MVLFNYSTRELTAKIVYYGPGLCGKTTNLQFIYKTLPETIRKGKMLSLATKTDRTLFFDFLPIDLGRIRGLRTRIQLYTVPGQVFYNSTRKLVLKGADGVVFVADSQKRMMETNRDSFQNLEDNLAELGLSLEAIPLVLQFNKRDLSDLASVEGMNSSLNRYNAPFYESVATTGIGVEDTLKAVTKLVLGHLSEKYHLESAQGRKRAEPASRAAPPARPPEPPPPADPAPSEETWEIEVEEAPEVSPAGLGVRTGVPRNGDEPVLEAEPARSDPAVTQVIRVFPDPTDGVEDHAPVDPDFSEIGEQEAETALEAILPDDDLGAAGGPEPLTPGPPAPVGGRREPASAHDSVHPAAALQLALQNGGEFAIPLELRLAGRTVRYRLRMSLELLAEDPSLRD